VLQHDRISIHRINLVTESLLNQLDKGLIPDDSKLFKCVNWLQFRKDISLAKVFASEGISVFTGSTFQRSSIIGKPSKRYAECGTAINAHIHNNCDSGFGIIIDRLTAEQFVPDRHVQKLSWEPASKEKGRLTCNCSGAGVSSSRPEVRLNCVEVHEEVM
jgi:hypothetical protein